MAAYIALLSLMHDLELLLDSKGLIYASEPVIGGELCADSLCSEQLFTPFTKKEVETLYQIVISIESFVRAYNYEIKTQLLERRISDVAYEAGNYVEFWAALCLPDPEVLPSVTAGVLDSASSTGEVDLKKIMLRSLIGETLEVKVISIPSFSRIGKTSFMKTLYHDPLVRNHFHIRVWVTVPKYQEREVLLGILSCVTNCSKEIYQKSTRLLRDEVHQCLKGKRYLIVLQGEVDIMIWNSLKGTFPDDMNGSRIMFTNLNDVHLASRYTFPFSLFRLNIDESCLTIDESWELLNSKIFRDGSCPMELMAIGRQIACECRGLPLAIVVVGELLSKINKRADIWVEFACNLGKEQILSLLEMREDGWTKVARTGGSLVMMKSKICQNILALSYNHVPDHLKKCLFCVGKFPEGYEIPVKKLIWLWVAEGFIVPTKPKRLEEVAEDYLEDLIARSLVLAERGSADGRIKTCYILDFVRELFLKESLINPLSDLPDERKGTLTEIALEFDIIYKELRKNDNGTKGLNIDAASSTGTSVTSLSLSRETPNAGVKLVGLEKDFETMLDGLTGHPSRLKVFSIIGMAGIGKTTFSRKLYDDPLVMHHFHVRIWATVSQQYQVRELLLGILRCVYNDEIYEKCIEDFREQVYKSLKGKRYLIVLDDMWDAKAWEDLKRTFPDDKNGSRIMLTSRLRDVAVHASQDTPPHFLRRLSVNESWELLNFKIFGIELCPMELMDVGKQIAYKCHGLPLAIVVIGGLLSKMNKKVDIWEEVALSVGSVVMEEAEHCENILALSYNHLPNYLKLCFLYLGVFPEDYEISVKKLIRLWVSEGFIRPNMIKSLEEVAEDYVEDLNARNLIMVKRKSSIGRIKTCYIHDLVREMCLRESNKLNFLHVINNCGKLPLENLGAESHRHLSFHSSMQNYINKTSLPYARSVMCFEKFSLSDPESHLGMNFKLLKVLDIMNIHLIVIPRDILCLAYLKSLALTIQHHFNMEWLSEILSLQTLIIDCEWDGQLPQRFWDMLELRHFHLKRICLPDSQLIEFQMPSTSASRVLSNIQSLSTIRPISCTKKVFLSMPNLKKLGIHEFEEDYPYRGWFKNLVHLQELERLKYAFSNPFSVSKPDRLPLWESFPPKLVKLTLSGTSLPWEEMVKLSMLPKLEVLKLRNFAFSGAVWKSSEGGFLRLKFLLIGSTDLEIWEADGTPFPKLERLVLRHCRSLEEIPHEIGEAPLLENIELHCCKDSAVNSARDLQEEQLSLGNEPLVVCIIKG